VLEGIIRERKRSVLMGAVREREGVLVGTVREREKCVSGYN